MCGIAGVFGAKSSYTNALHPGPDFLKRRGPDGSGHGTWSSDNVSCDLFHTRLAINDLTSAGDQPFESEDGAVIVVFNGEIYNSPELRRRCEVAGHVFRSRMDGEVIAHLWEMDGAACLKELNGIFAIAVLDQRTMSIALARDPLGVKPLFFSIDRNNTLWFASELDALSEMGAILGDEDTIGLAQFLTFLWIPSPRTPYRNAHSLQPGETLCRNSAGFKMERYVSPFAPAPRSEQVGSEALREELDRHFGAAVKRQMLSDVPIAIMASGGLDSSLIWEEASSDIKAAYTIGWSAGESHENLHEDVTSVRALSSHLGTNVVEIAGETVRADLLPESGDLFADPAYRLTKSIAARANDDGYKVLLSGQGADEVFGGYRRHQIARLLGIGGLTGAGAYLARRLQRVANDRLSIEYGARLGRALAERDPFCGYMQLGTYSSASQRAQLLGQDEREVSDEVVWSQHRAAYDALPSGISFLRKAMAIDLQVYLPGLGLAYVDRAGMSEGVEIRVPWLDLEIVRWSMTLPDRALIKGRVGKRLPRLLGMSKLPASIANRPKRGFGSPLSQLPASLDVGVGGRGFRQDRYVALAASMLLLHRADRDRLAS